MANCGRICVGSPQCRDKRRERHRCQGPSSSETAHCTQTADVLLNAKTKDGRDGLKTAEVLAQVLLNAETRDTVRKVLAEVFINTDMKSGIFNAAHTVQN